MGRLKGSKNKRKNTTKKPCKATAKLVGKHIEVKASVPIKKSLTTKKIVKKVGKKVVTKPRKRITMLSKSAKGCKGKKGVTFKKCVKTGIRALKQKKALKN